MMIPRLLMYPLLALLVPIQASALDDRTQAWRQVEIMGVDYVSLAEMMNFYQMELQAHQGESWSYGNKSTSLVMDSRMPFILIDGVAVKLLHPLRKDGRGEQLIAKTDCIHLLDPILRTHYLTPRLSLRRIVIDPCHGGVFQEVRSSERKEKAALVLAMAQSLKALLEAQGFDVQLTRQADYFVSPQERVDLANNSPDSLFVQLRLNDYHDALGGVQSYIAEPNDARVTDCSNAALGMAMQSYLTVGAGFKDDGLRRVKNDMLSGVRVPAVSIALGNMGNQQQRVELHDDAKQQAMVKAIHAAINAFGVAVAPNAPADSSSEVDAIAEPDTSAETEEDLPAIPVEEDELQAVEVE